MERVIELEIGGMTCAACANRIEKKLNRIDGVSATVNYATEKARATVPAALSAADLIAVVEKTGYTAAEPQPLEAAKPEASRDTLRDRLILSAVLSVPVIVLAMVPAWQFDYWQWLSLTLAAPVVAYGGWPFHRSAVVNLRHGAATMDTLVSMGTLAAFGWSVWALFLGDAGMPGMVHPFSLTAREGDAIYLEAAAGVTTFLLAGRYLEARAKRHAGDALRALLSLGAKNVTILENGAEREIPATDLRVNTLFLVRPGEKVATDGEVVEGSSALDVSLLTGESVPVEVRPGDQVTGATINAGGRLVVRATRVGADTQLAQMARLVEEAQNGKAAVQRLADRISGVFVPVVIALAVGTLGYWTGTGQGVTAAFTAAVAVLIIACPCALGLATPTALLVGTGRGAQMGILIRGVEALESTRRVDTIVLDKTGTVTTGRMSVTSVVSASGDSEHEDEVLRLAGAVETASEHPIGRAIAEAARARGPLPAITDFQATAGVGVRGKVEGFDVAVAAGAPGQAQDAQTWVEVTRDGDTVGWIALADTVRPSSAGAVARLKRLGLEPMLVTGDSRAVADAVAAEVGITRVEAGVLPAGKVDVVKQLQSQGRSVAMVGDGVNDAAALAQADLGLAMGAGTDVAIQASDLTLVRGDLTAAVDAVRLSRRTLGIIRGNLFWAFAYNVAGLPLAAAGLLNPMIAGAAMAFSSVFVVLNSLRLRGFGPDNQTA
ncbi:cadmium-translocating P-type ATPase [Actinoplanes bogorensis]|uniref:Cadmium-translocating P-type ATPase n=1 Tax=Paractinoplanes bogorensis TaxID=1610840 RepID=A0ABS5YFC1_9ACTN|nr:heavy metal translocating P-type ATPase [Actinoplanes bogorensis]MBU2662011.1 cadmium-translocating P-type ATPase [Actinoplanes bogorensis]